MSIKLFFVMATRGDPSLPAKRPFIVSLDVCSSRPSWMRLSISRSVTVHLFDSELTTS
jgi:hypothetical protein